MAAPADRPKWAATNVNLPNTGQANKQQPSTTLQDVGIDFGQIPTAEEENWWKANVYEWVQYLVDEKIPAVEATVSETVPRGVVQAYAFDSEPAGWIICDGRILDGLTPFTDLRTDLINAGFPYGQDGSSNPKIPDLRGEFIRGFDDGRGIDSGRVHGTTQTDAFQGHWHNLQIGSTDNTRTGTIDGGNGTGPVSTTNVKAPISDGVNGTPRTASETRPRNVAMHYIIKT